MAGYNLRSRKRMKLETPVPATEEDPGPIARALSNEYILAELCSHLSVKDLTECRFVNRVWNQEATRAVATKGKQLKFTSSWNENDMERVRKFMDTMSTSWNFPFRKFTISSELLEKATPDDRRMILKFMKYLAPIVNHLGIYARNCQLMFSTRAELEDLHYPCLTSLILHIHAEEKETVNQSYLDFLIYVLEHAPKLERICLSYDMFDGHGKSLLAFYHVLQHVPWNKIRHLQLDGQFEKVDTYLQTIMQLGPEMKLESFEFSDVLRTRTAPVFLSKFLEHQRKTLKSLSLDLQWLITNHKIRFPEFLALETFHLEFYYTDDEYIDSDEEDVESLDRTGEFCILALPSFSRGFPVLKSLTILVEDWRKLDRLVQSEDGRPSETVQEIIFFQPYASIEGTLEVDECRRVARQMSKMFPNVKKLGIPAHREILKAIEKEKVWKDVTELTVSTFYGNGGDIDSTLTGYSSEKCDRLCDVELGTWEWQQIEAKAERRIYNFLHQLKTLKLEGWHLPNFSDISCILVLMKLRNLKSLNLCNLRVEAVQVSGIMLSMMNAKFEVLCEKKLKERFEILG